MHRLRIAISLALAAPACIEVPQQPNRPNPQLADGSIVAELSVDASLRRPATGEPYTGGETSAHPQSRMDASTRADAASPGRGPMDAGARTISPAPSRVSRPAPAQDDAGGSVVPAMSGPQRPSSTGQIVITEIMSNPQAVSDEEGEWIELYNTGADDLDLAGCVIDDGGRTPHAIKMPLVIGAGRFVTIARSAKAGFNADLVLPISLSNASDSVTLRCDTNEIDQVAYGAGFPLSPGASMSLDPGAFDAVTNDAASAWCLVNATYGADRGTPGAANPPCDSADAGTD
jgi:hypothetical protein